MFGTNLYDMLSLNNGFMILLCGSLLTYLHSTIHLWFTFLLQQIILSIEIPSNDLAYEWIIKWLTTTTKQDDDAHSNQLFKHTTKPQKYTDSSIPTKHTHAQPDQNNTSISSIIQPISFESQSLTLSTSSNNDSGRAIGFDALAFMNNEELEEPINVESTRILLSPGPGIHILWYKYHLIIIYCDRHVDMNDHLSRQRQGLSTVSPGKIVLYTLGRNKQIIIDIVRQAMLSTMNQEQHLVSIYGLGNYGRHGWTRELSRHKRSIDTVILDAGVSERIVSDARTFLSNREWYESLGIPYHRGYLFYGEPGCGKSSFVLSLASILNLSICMVNLCNQTLNDQSLTQLLRSAPSNAIIVFEDIDAAFPSRDMVDLDDGDDDDDKDSNRDLAGGNFHPYGYGRNARRSLVTLSGLLNAIDGVSSQNGRIIVMTTNYRERLDSALIRPGRVDISIEFTLATCHQIKAMFQRFYCNPGNEDQSIEELSTIFASQLEEKTISMAELQNYFLLYRDQPQQALSNISTIIQIAQHKKQINNEKLQKREIQLFLRSQQQQAKKLIIQQKIKQVQDAMEKSKQKTLTKNSMNNTDIITKRDSDVKRDNEKEGLTASATHTVQADAGTPSSSSTSTTTTTATNDESVTSTESSKSEEIDDFSELTSLINGAGIKRRPQFPFRGRGGGVVPFMF